jgi:uncharacterized protein (DUF885 family)
MAAPNHEFERLRDGYYRAWFRYHPEAAVELGVQGYAGHLTPYADDDIGALVRLNEKLLDSVEELDYSGLDPDHRIDAQIMVGAAVLEIEALSEHDWRRRDPQRYLPLNAIYQLTIRDIDDFASALIGRLMAIPAYLRDARQFLMAEPEQIPPLWIESSVVAAESGMDYLRGLTENPKVSDVGKRHRELNDLINQGIEALRHFAGFLQQDLGPKAGGDFACGRKRFEMLLELRHFLDVDAGQLHALGTELFAHTSRDLKRVCRELSGDDDVRALMAKIQADHPTSHTLINTYREQMNAAREFLTQKDLVTLPEREALTVVETPLFLRHEIPFAAYLEPAPDDVDQHGYYYVTPADQPETLAEHNYVGLMSTCAHEAYPGHHLQFVTANVNPVARTFPRLLNASATMYEGWALYCEQMMREQGFLNKPEHEFILLKDRLWRAMRIMIDVEIHTRGTKLADASERMQRQLGFHPSQAMADLTWYSRCPTVPLGYATGWSLINAARDRCRAEDPGFNLRDFHDQLLAGGSMALSLVLRRVFGADIEQRAREIVFRSQ